MIDEGIVVQDETDVESIARTFVTARNTGTPLLTYPGTAPSSLAQAYLIQDAALTLANRPVAGWKVGKVDPPVDGSNRLAGPIFADQVVLARDNVVPDMPVFAAGFAAAEAEFLLRIAAAPDPAKTSYSIDEARALIDAVHVGIEIASSPYPGINADGPAVTVSDFGNNNGLIVGSAIEDWSQIDLDSWSIGLSINGEEVGRATTATMLDGPFGAARFLLEHMAARGVVLPAGTWISSGAVTGVHPVNAGDAVQATFGKGRNLSCRIVAG